VLVALDGRSGVGKSTIANGLVERLDGALISGDDFYAGGTDAEWTARTPEQRRARVFDWHRLRVDALDPLLAGRVAAWRSFNWQTWEGLSEDLLVCEPAPVIVLDMVYSCGPELSDLVDLSVLVTLDDEERIARLAARDGAEHRDRWLALWESAENHYFTHIRRPDSFDLVVTT
jgi:uridine kinase